MQSDGGFDDQPAARQRYEKALIQLGHDEAQWETLGLKNLSIGWAIGTDGWKKSLAKELRQTALEPGLHRTEVRATRNGLTPCNPGARANAHSCNSARNERLLHVEHLTVPTG